MEKIVGIKNYENEDGYFNVAGFEVVTDKQSIKLYIENERYCCERWGYFWSNDNPHDFVGAELRGVSLTDTALNEAQMRANDLNPTNRHFRGGLMFVNIGTDRGMLQFVAYNEHDGDYGHEAKVQCTQLMHQEVL